MFCLFRKFLAWSCSWLSEGVYTSYTSSLYCHQNFSLNSWHKNDCHESMIIPIDSSRPFVVKMWKGLLGKQMQSHKYLHPNYSEAGLIVIFQNKFLFTRPTVNYLQETCAHLQVHNLLVTTNIGFCSSEMLFWEPLSNTQSTLLGHLTNAWASTIHRDSGRFCPVFNFPLASLLSWI